MPSDIFWRIDKDDNFESLVVEYDTDNGIDYYVSYIQYFDGNIAVGYYPQTSETTINEECEFKKYENNKFYINLAAGTFSAFWVQKTGKVAEFYFWSDAHYIKNASYADFGFTTYQPTFIEAKNALENSDELFNSRKFPWRIWRETYISDSCISYYNITYEIVYDDSYKFSPDGQIKLFYVPVKIIQNIASEYKAKLSLNLINQDKERQTKIRIKLENQAKAKISQDVCYLEEPTAAIKQNIDSIVKIKISESINQPIAKIKQEIKYEFQAGAKVRLFIYIRYHRFRANIKLNVNSVVNTKIKQDITQIPVVNIVEYLENQASVKISEDIKLIPQTKLKIYTDSSSKIKIKELLTLIPECKLKINTRTYNRIPSDYYDYYNIQTFGFLKQ